MSNCCHSACAAESPSRNLMRPKLVIPCHYNCPAFFTKTYNPADDGLFKAEVEKTGAQCVILQMGDSVDLNNDE